MLIWRILSAIANSVSAFQIDAPLLRRLESCNSAVGEPRLQIVHKTARRQPGSGNVCLQGVVDLFGERREPVVGAAENMPVVFVKAIDKVCPRKIIEPGIPLGHKIERALPLACGALSILALKRGEGDDK